MNLVTHYVSFFNFPDGKIGVIQCSLHRNMSQTSVRNYSWTSAQRFESTAGGLALASDRLRGKYQIMPPPETLTSRSDVVKYAPSHFRSQKYLKF